MVVAFVLAIFSVLDGVAGMGFAGHCVRSL